MLAIIVRGPFHYHFSSQYNFLRNRFRTKHPSNLNWDGEPLMKWALNVHALLSAMRLKIRVMECQQNAPSILNDVIRLIKFIHHSNPAKVWESMCDTSVSVVDKFSTSIYPWPLFTKRSTSYRNISWSLEAARFASRLFNRLEIWQAAAETPVKFQSDTIITTSNLAASRLHEIVR